MTGNGKCIVVSDVHLGIEYSNRSKFIDFIDNLGDDVDRLVLLGDILEFWRRDPVGVMLENIDIIQKFMSLEPEELMIKKYEEYAIELVNEKYKGEFLIYGHSRKPYVKTEINLANSGSWVKGSSDYLEIDEHGVVLKSY